MGPWEGRPRLGPDGDLEGSAEKAQGASPLHYYNLEPLPLYSTPKRGCPRTPTEGWTSCSSKGHTGGHGIWCPGRCGYPNRCPVGAIERIFKCASFWFLDVRMRTSKWQGKWPFCTLRWQNFPPPAEERGLRRRLRRALMEDLPLRRATVPPIAQDRPKLSQAR